MQGPVLGLDLGERRIGLAVSDLAAAIAFPIGALDRQSLAVDIHALCDLIRERGVVAVVVGLPLHLSGRPGTGAEAARRFAKALGEASALPVELVDERLTTVLAERALREQPRGRGRGRRPAKGQVDAIAAALILRTYLEQPRERKEADEVGRGAARRRRAKAGARARAQARSARSEPKASEAGARQTGEPEGPAGGRS